MQETLLLPGCFREELRQRIWERGQSWGWPHRVLLSYSLAEKSLLQLTMAPKAGRSHLPLMENGGPSQNVDGCWSEGAAAGLLPNPSTDLVPRHTSHPAVL